MKSLEIQFLRCKNKQAGGLQDQFKMTRRCFDKLFKNKTRQYCKGNLLCIDECRITDPNEFWKHINNLGPKKKAEIPWEVEINGEKRTAKNVVLKRWHKVFKQIYNVEGSGFDDTFKKQWLSEPLKSTQITSNINKKIGLNEIETAINRLKSKKAAGLDLVPNELLKNDGVKALLHSLFSVCLQYGLIPDIWRRVVIHPIPKLQGRLIDLQKYRGIALQCCIFKVLSSIINSRVVEFMDKNSILADEQNGFRKTRSCLHHIFGLTNIIRKHCLEGGGNNFSAFIDFRKAFDSIDRDLMLRTLTDNGINGRIWKLTWQMYEGTTSSVHINGHYTEEFESKLGVLQGNNYSPTIFIAFINDLIGELCKNSEGIWISNNRKLNTLAYADDIVIFAMTENGLQYLLNMLSDWCIKWRVTINPEKSKIVHF